MGKCYVLVHASSYRYIRNIADYVYLQIRKNSQTETELRICERLDDAPLEPDSIVYIIGEPFNFTAKAPGCKYVFLNFSVVCLIGNPLSCSIRGYLQIRRKRRILEQKMGFLDYILDYWPTQTSVMKEWATVPVRTFPIAMSPIKSAGTWGDLPRKFDVCIVGGESPRRSRIISKLRKLGLCLSPTSGVDLEEAAAESKIVLNVHSERCNHLEYPRMIGAFMTKSVLVSEYILDMEKYFPPDIYVSTKYARIVGSIESLLANPVALGKMADAAWAWMTGTYLVDCELGWSNLVREIRNHLYPSGRN